MSDMQKFAMHDGSKRDRIIPFLLDLDSIGFND